MSKALSKASPGHVQGKGGVKGGKAYCILGFRVPTTSVGQGGKAYCILGFRVPTTSVGARGEGAKGVKGNEVYSILGCRVPTTSVGARGEGGRREDVKIGGV